MPAATRVLVAVVTLAMSVATVLAVTSPASARTWAVPKTTSSETPATLDDFEDQVIVEINAARRAHGKRRIRYYDTCVDRLAERWGRRIKRTGAFEHRDQKVVMRRCRTVWAGENLVRGTGLSAREMVQLWLDSPGHRAILLHRNARRAGVAVKRDRQGRLIGVLNVARPR